MCLTTILLALVLCGRGESRLLSSTVKKEARRGKDNNPTRHVSEWNNISIDFDFWVGLRLLSSHTAQRKFVSVSFLLGPITAFSIANGRQ